MNIVISCYGLILPSVLDSVMRLCLKSDDAIDNFTVSRETLSHRVSQWDGRWKAIENHKRLNLNLKFENALIKWL